MNDGWIRLHRSCLDHWLYNEYRPLTRREAWETILFTVNFEPSKCLIKGQLYDCDRGQSLLSLQSWAEKFVWSVKQVRTFFSLLEKDEMISTEGLQYTTRLTVCNYDLYQSSGQTEGKPRADGGQAEGKPRATIKEREERKELKNNKNKEEPAGIRFEIDERFKATIGRWFEYKVKIKSAYKTEESEKACYNMLIKLSNNDSDLAGAIVEQSIAQGWKGLFELRTASSQPSFKTQENKGHVPPSKYGPDFDPSKQRF